MLVSTPAVTYAGQKFPNKQPIPREKNEIWIKQRLNVIVHAGGDLNIMIHTMHTVHDARTRKLVRAFEFCEH